MATHTAKGRIVARPKYQKFSFHSSSLTEFLPLIPSQKGQASASIGVPKIARAAAVNLPSEGDHDGSEYALGSVRGSAAKPTIGKRAAHAAMSKRHGFITVSLGYLLGFFLDRKLRVLPRSLAAGHFSDIEAFVSKNAGRPSRAVSAVAVDRDRLLPAQLR